MEVSDVKYLAAQYEGNHELRIIEKEVPILGEKDVLIHISAATICGTDLTILEGNFHAKPPVVTGHEFSGVVADIGNEVTSVQIGDLVTVEPHLFCGLCRYCRNGREHLCLHKKGFGVLLDGGFAQCCIVPDRTVYKVPNDISPSVAALTENIGCCIHGIEQADVNIGDHVTIIGGGFVGVVLAELAKARGAREVCVIEPNDFRRKFIQKRGFDVVDPTYDDAVEAIKDKTSGFGSEVVIEAAGKVETAELSLKLVDYGGTVLLFGVVPPNKKINISPHEVFKKELSIVGSVINPYTHLRAVEMLNNLKLEPLISHHFELKDIHKAFSVAEKGEGFKVAIHPNGL